MTEDPTQQRRAVGVGDWFHALVNVLIGLLLGSWVHGMITLVVSGAWAMVLLSVLFLMAMIAIVASVELADRLLARIFGPGIRPPSVKYPKAKKPLFRVLSLPVGCALGILLALLGLDQPILNMLP